jgi:hypothetical protein
MQSLMNQKVGRPIESYLEIAVRQTQHTKGCKISVSQKSHCWNV